MLNQSIEERGAKKIVEWIEKKEMTKADERK
jgi:hypothetical protein